MSLETPYISPGNTKLKRIPNVSLTPGASCPSGLPCYHQCYANRSRKRYSTADRAWRRNWDMWRKDPNGYFTAIGEYLAKRRPSLFRWHVGGDIPSQSYLRCMAELAEKNPWTQFLVFTKNHSLDFDGLPGNLCVILSMWPGWGSTADNADMPRCWLADKRTPDGRIPDNAYKCPGDCQTCGQTDNDGVPFCWRAAADGRDVAIKAH